MTEEEIIELYPRLWHMAEDGSWPSIQQHGLLSTTALLDLYGYAPTDPFRIAVEEQRRAESVPISRPGLANAVIRDQKPMSDGALLKCLDGGLTPTDWYRTLNAKVFFWLSRERLRRLLGAKAYRDQPQTVLTIDTRSLVEANVGYIMLSPINSGSTIMNPVRRGPQTFKAPADYPFAEWKKKRNARDAVVELTVAGQVVPMAQHVLAAHRVHQGNAVELWRSPAAVADDGP